MPGTTCCPPAGWLVHVVCKRLFVGELCVKKKKHLTEIYDKSRLINNKIKYIQQKMKKKNG